PGAARPPNLSQPVPPPRRPRRETEPPHRRTSWSRRTLRTPAPSPLRTSQIELSCGPVCPTLAFTQAFHGGAPRYPSAPIAAATVAVPARCAALSAPGQWARAEGRRQAPPAASPPRAATRRYLA